MSNRINVLSKILNEQIIKEAQEMIEQQTQNQEVDPATADQLAKDIFDKLFNEEMNKIFNQS